MFSIMKKSWKIFTCLLIVLLAVNFSAEAQCAMCKANVEGVGKEELSRGINMGILYLMATPYLILGTIGYLWYKKSKKNQAQRELLDKRNLI